MMNIFLIVIFAVVFLGLTLKKFEWGVFLLFLLLPSYLLRLHLGPIPSTFLEIIVLTVSGIYIFKNKKIFFSFFKLFFQKNKILSIGTLLFLVGATIGIFASVDVEKALGEWRAFYVEPILLFFVLSSYFDSLKNKEKIRKILNYLLLPLLLSGFVTSFLAIYQHFTGWLVPDAFWANRNTYRVTAWYGFPNAVGLFLAPLIPLTFFLIKNSWKQRTEHIPRVTLVLSLLYLVTTPFALVFAKGSGPIIGVLGGIGFLLLNYKKTRLPAICLGVIGVIGLFLLPTQNLLKQELLFQDRSAQLRLDMWHETKKLLQDRPILGSGIASYEERILPYRQDRQIEVFHHPHNIFLTLWVNTGLIGLLGFIGIIISCALVFIRDKEPETKFFLSSMVVVLVMGLVDSPYIKNDLAILFWVIVYLIHQRFEPKHS